ncbi:DoxX family membrane protein [Tenacibaculum sp. TC6]|uniref:DoxX family membrane protein n=1 Tax=Tenacibaculum sp. TC6 TaxID=3423223 RepID=UPI003D37001A
MKAKIFFVLYLLFGLMFINAGLNKFLNYMPVPEGLPEKMMQMNTAFISIEWLLPLVGIIEIISGTLFLVPKFRLLGAFMIFPILIGILLTNIVAMPSGLPIPIVLLAINISVFTQKKELIKPILNNSKKS